MAHPWTGSSETVFRISRSTVPWTRSVGLLMVPSFNDMNSVVAILGRSPAVVSNGGTRRPLAARRQVLGEHYALVPQCGEALRHRFELLHRSLSNSRKRRVM